MDRVLAELRADDAEIGSVDGALESAYVPGLRQLTAPVILRVFAGKSHVLH